jgi:hypothetical protein
VLGPGAHDPLLVAAAPPMGVRGRPARRQTIVPFGEGSLACLLTDGASEARTADGLVGREQLTDWLRELGPSASAQRVVELVRERAAVTDDVAVCVAHGRRGADTGSWRVEELHLAGGDADAGEAERFLSACAVADGDRAKALAAVAAAGGAVVRVRLEDGVPATVTVAEGDRVAVGAA